MANVLFPSTSFPGIKLTVTKEPIWATKVHTSSSGMESRIALQSSCRYRYSVDIEFLRTGKNGNEVATLLNFINSRYGSKENFRWVDPSLGTEVWVRFEGDGFVLKQFADGYYSTSFKLITVKSETT